MATAKARHEVPRVTLPAFLIDSTSLVSFAGCQQPHPAFLGERVSRPRARDFSTYRRLSSSCLGLPFRILTINHKKELLRGRWVKKDPRKVSPAWRRARVCSSLFSLAAAATDVDAFNASANQADMIAHLSNMQIPDPKP